MPEPESTDGVPRMHRRSARTATDIPVQLKLLDAEGLVLATGTGVLSDLSEDGLRLSLVALEQGALPARAHFALVVPEAPEMRGLWIKACVVRAAFRAENAELGAYIVSATRALRRLLDEPVADRA